VNVIFIVALYVQLFRTYTASSTGNNNKIKKYIKLLSHVTLIIGVFIAGYFNALLCTLFCSGRLE